MEIYSFKKCDVLSETDILKCKLRIMGIDGHSHVIGQVRLLLGKRKRNNNYRWKSREWNGNGNRYIITVKDY